MVNNGFQKDANFALVADAIRTAGTISRADIARKLSMHRSTVSNIVNGMLEGGLAVEGEEGSSGPSGGRKPVGVSLNAAFGLVVGVDFQADRWNACAMDVSGRVIARFGGIPGRASPEAAMRAALGEVELECASVPVPVLGACVALPGVVDPERGVVLRSDAFESPGLDFSGLVAAGYRFPVLAENDANACAWRDIALQVAPRTGHSLSVLFEPRPDGAGVGLGMAMGRKVYRGASMAAGEFASRGIVAGTESRGPWPAWSSEPGIRGDAARAAAVAAAGADLAPLVFALDPETVTVHAPWDAAPGATFRQGFFGRVVSDGRIVTGMADSRVTVPEGAAAFFLETLFGSPEPGRAKTGGVSWEAAFVASGARGVPWRAGGNRG